MSSPAPAPSGGTSSGTPILVAGMHRSGTSLTAQLLERLGVVVAPRPIPADRHNVFGYGEDPAFVAFHREVCAATAEPAPGHEDWGWTVAGSAPPLWPDRFEARARALVADRSRATFWGFKDPRSTLFLESWLRTLRAATGNEPYVVLVYRYPWDVAESMQRLGAPHFLRHPTWAYRIWELYNSRVLAYREAHPETTILLSANALVRHPDRLRELLVERWAIPLEGAPLEGVPDRSSFRETPIGDPLASLVVATTPVTRDVFERLEGLSDQRSSADRPTKIARRGTASDSEIEVSIVLPCFDHGQLLLEAIASVLRLDPDGRWEVLIVDDGSTEERTLEVLRHLEERGLRVLRQANRGLSAARNNGFRAARGRFVLPLDADNRICAGFVPEAADALRRDPELAGVYGDRSEFGMREGVRRVGPWDVDRLLGGNYIDACALVRRSVWEEIGGYDEELEAWEDWDLWLAVADRGLRLHYLPGVAFEYRVRPESLVTRAEEQRFREGLVARIVFRHRPLFDRRWQRFPVLRDWANALERNRDSLWVRGQDVESEREHAGHRIALLERRIAELDTRARETTDLLGRKAAEEERTAIWARELESRIRDAEAERGLVGAELEKVAAWTRQLQAQIRAKDAETERVRNELESVGSWARRLENEIAQAGAARGALEEELGRAGTWARQLEDQLAAVTTWARQLEDQVLEAGTSREALEQELASVTTWARQLERGLRDALAAREALADDLSESRAAEDLQRRRAERVGSQLREMRHEADRIRRSRAWRVVERVWRTVDALLPAGSRRRRVWDRFRAHDE